VIWFLSHEEGKENKSGWGSVSSLNPPPHPPHFSDPPLSLPCPPSSFLSFPPSLVRMDRYKQQSATKEGEEGKPKRKARLVWPKGADKKEVGGRAGGKQGGREGWMEVGGVCLACLHISEFVCVRVMLQCSLNLSPYLAFSPPSSHLSRFLPPPPCPPPSSPPSSPPF
jgi:hypothetical protein